MWLERDWRWKKLMSVQTKVIANTTYAARATLAVAAATAAPDTTIGQLAAI